MAKRYTIAVDFDGVIHSYTSPWVDAATIPDPPVEGAIDWLHEMLQSFDVTIFSTRCATALGRLAMRAWLKSHCSEDQWRDVGHDDGGIRWGLHGVRYGETKPKALVYIDDRAWRFEGPGTFPTKDQIHRARPWHKKGEDV